MRIIQSILLLALFCVLPQYALAGGLLKHTVPKLGYISPEAIDIETHIRDQVAQTTARQFFVNTSGRDMLVHYGFPLGLNATVTSLRWTQNGKNYKAELTGKPQDTTDAASGGSGGTLDHAFLNHLGKSPLLFSFPDTLRADSVLEVELEYIELLEYGGAKVRYRYPLSLGAFRQHDVSLQIDIALDSQRELVGLISETHEDMTLEYGAGSATARLYNNHAALDMDLLLEMEYNQDDLGVSVLSTKPDEKPGYFVMLAEPDPKTAPQEVIAKTFTFILDVSGSMNGNKLQQAREAARFAIDNLNAGDKFNIMAFNSSVSSFRAQPVPATVENVQAGRDFVDKLSANGGTNIQLVLQSALAQEMGPNTANVIIFLTDGLATVDLDAVEQANTSDTRIYVFGIGNDVNKNLLTQIAARNNGIAEFLENDAVSDRVGDFYSKIRSPFIIDVALDFPGAGVNELYPLVMPNLYVGEQLVVAGRYENPGPTKSILSGKAAEQEVEYEYDIAFAADGAENAFLPKVWAKFKMDALLVLMTGVNEGSNQWKEWKEEVIRLSLEYGILSPFTSFIAGKEEDDDDDRVSDVETEYETGSRESPLGFMIAPNPVRTHARFHFTIPDYTARQNVVIRIYDAAGKLVALVFNGAPAAGPHSIEWRAVDAAGADLAAGVYYCIVEYDSRRYSYPLVIAPR